MAVLQGQRDPIYFRACVRWWLAMFTLQVRVAPLEHSAFARFRDEPMVVTWLCLRTQAWDCGLVLAFCGGVGFGFVFATQEVEARFIGSGKFGCFGKRSSTGTGAGISVSS